MALISSLTIEKYWVKREEKKEKKRKITCEKRYRPSGCANMHTCVLKPVELY